MTFTLNEVIVTLLAMAQFTSPSPDIVRSYDGAKPELIAADVSKGCRSLFSDPKYYSAEQIDKLVHDLKIQRAELNKTAPPSLVPNLPPQPNDLSPKSQNEGTPEIIDTNEDSEFQAPEGLEDGDTDFKKDENGAEIILSQTENSPGLAQMLEGLSLLPGLTFDQQLDVWEAVCRENIDLSLAPTIDWQEVAEKYNEAVQSLPDYRVLKGYRLPETSYIYDAEGNAIRELYNNQGRRTWIALNEIPKHLQNAFLAAEDKNFASHKGIEPQGILQGFVKFVQSGRERVEGGSTITQQVIKNLLVGSARALDRKIREMLIAKQVEGHLSKPEILEIYLNLIFLGRSSWGVEMAALNYFGKSARELDIAESAFIAGTTHIPSHYEPSNPKKNIKKRTEHVIKQMVLNGMIAQSEANEALQVDLTKRFLAPPEITKGNDYVTSAVKSALIKVLPAEKIKQGGMLIRTTIQPDLQVDTQESLQEGLFEYEVSYGRIKWTGPIAKLNSLNLETIEGETPSWVQPLTNIILEYSDIQWDIAVILKKQKRQHVIGLANGSIALLSKASGWSANAAKSLAPGDVVFVKGQGDGTYALRTAPQVEGAAVVMDPKTGKVLAIVGGFSATYSRGNDKLDEFNRAISAYRQPGSTIKPFSYLAALQSGFQPNTLVPNRPTPFPPIFENKRSICQGWSPKNYSNKQAPILTLRQGLETSNNRVTAQLIKAIAPDNFMDGLDQVRGLTQEFGVFDDPEGCIAFILGTQGTTPLRMAVAYSAIANGGYRVSPRFIDAITDLNRTKVPFEKLAPQPIELADPISIFQLRSILEGVVTRGTAKRIKDLSGFVAGKTGTSNNSYDAWFVGFTGDLVISIWVGYDRNRSLGNSGKDGTGGSVALPIFEKIIRKYFETKEQIPFAAPPEGISLAPTSVKCGDYVPDGFNRFTEKDVVNEAFRLNSSDTMYSLISYNPCGNGEQFVNPRKKITASPSQQEPPPLQKRNLSKKEKRKKKRKLFDLY